MGCCTTGKVYVMSWTEHSFQNYGKKVGTKTLVSYFWRKRCWLLQEREFSASELHTNHLQSEFRLPNYYTSKEYLKYCLENELSMKFIYLQIPTLYLASSDILPHTQDFPSCICLKRVSYGRFVDHTQKEVSQFNIKILSVKRFFGRPAVLCC